MFRFTIRDVLWLTVVVGLGCAWWTDRTKLAEKYDHAMNIIANLDWAARQDRTLQLYDWPNRPTDNRP